MTKARVLVFLVCLATLAGGVLPARSQGAITVTNADQIRQLAPSFVASLGSPVSEVSPRVHVDYANILRTISLMSPPPALQARLAEVPRKTYLPALHR
jgi:hypothetical protein